MLPGFSAQQSWPGCPVATAASGSATLGGEEEAGHDLERLVAGWQAVLSVLSWLQCAISPRLLGRGSGDCIQMPIVCPSAGSRARRERGSGSI